MHAPSISVSIDQGLRCGAHCDSDSTAMELLDFASRGWRLGARRGRNMPSCTTAMTVGSSQSLGLVFAWTLQGERQADGGFI